jgi:hypothetical protein
MVVPKAGVAGGEMVCTAKLTLPCCLFCDPGLLLGKAGFLHPLEARIPAIVNRNLDVSPLSYRRTRVRN